MRSGDHLGGVFACVHNGVFRLAAFWRLGRATENG